MGVFEEYTDEPMPMGSYAALTTAFGGMMGAALVAAARSGRLPDHVSLGDLALLGVATHKLSRLIARDTVTSWLRAPFTHHEGPGGANELNDRPRGEGARLAIGQLIFCPPCIGQWIAGGLVAGWLNAPRLTRAVAATFTTVAVSDFLNLAYTAARERAST
jgi:hypothetical protein